MLPLDCSLAPTHIPLSFGFYTIALLLLFTLLLPPHLSFLVGLSSVGSSSCLNIAHRFHWGRGLRAPLPAPPFSFLLNNCIASPVPFSLSTSSFSSTGFLPWAHNLEHCSPFHWGAPPSRPPFSFLWDHCIASPFPSPLCTSSFCPRLAFFRGFTTLNIGRKGVPHLRPLPSLPSHNLSDEGDAQTEDREAAVQYGAEETS